MNLLNHTHLLKVHTHLADFQMVDGKCQPIPVDCLERQTNIKHV